MTKHSSAVEVYDIPTFFAGVLNVLRYWRDVHTDAESWADMTIVDNEYKGHVRLEDICLSNSYYKIDPDDIKLELAKIAMKDAPSFYCYECGYEGEENFCDECDKDEHMSSNEPEDFMHSMDFSAVPVDELRDVLISCAFPIYSDAISSIITTELETVNFYISKMEKAETNIEKLEVLIQSLSIAHVNGEILEDYLSDGMYGIEFEQILDIREMGLESNFDAEHVKEYMDS